MDIQPNYFQKANRIYQFSPCLLQIDDVHRHPLEVLEIGQEWVLDLDVE